jgi:hypothetical protein
VVDEAIPHQISPDRRVGLTCALLVWLGSWLCCGLAIVYFYNLSGSTYYPFESRSQQIITAFRTALIATIISSGISWLVTASKPRLRMSMLRVALTTQAILTLFALSGHRLAISTRQLPILDWGFPSIFFAEYNWMTFILEVAPATSIAVLLWLHLCSKVNE